MLELASEAAQGPRLGWCPSGEDKWTWSQQPLSQGGYKQGCPWGMARMPMLPTEIAPGCNPAGSFLKGCSLLRDPWGTLIRYLSGPQGPLDLQGCTQEAVCPAQVCTPPPSSKAWNRGTEAPLLERPTREERPAQEARLEESSPGRTRKRGQ